MSISKKYKRGDTIIEVLFAISIFSLIAVGGLSIMNKGNTVTQRALEITLVRQQIDAQAETLRFLNSSYIKAYTKDAPIDSYGAKTTDPVTGDTTPAKPAYKWAELSSSITTSPASEFGADLNECPELEPDSFIFNTNSANLVKLTDTNFNSPSSYSQIRIDNTNGLLKSSDGLWIEAVRSVVPPGNRNEDKIGYIDFHIRACWPSIGQAAPMTIGTIVRLYEPR